MRKIFVVIACAAVGLGGAVTLEAIGKWTPQTASQPMKAVVNPQPPAAAQSPAAQQAPSTPSAASMSPARDLVTRYCVTCHNEKLKTADLMLDKADQIEVHNSAPIWEKVIQKLRTRAMPPPGNRRPDAATYDTVAGWLESELDRAGAANPNPGRPGIHRLNRAEYAQVIRDVLAVEIDARQLLPPDGAAFGFDNIAEALSVTPGLLDRYLSAATKIAREAVGDPTIPAGFETYNVLKNLWQSDWRGEDFPLNSRGGVAVKHYFPVDGEYVLKLKLTRTYTALIRGLQDVNVIEIRVDGARVEQFTVGGKFQGASGRGNAELSEYQRTADNGLEVRVPLKAGTRQVVATIVKTMAAEPEGLGPANLPIWNYAYADNPNTQMGIASVLIGGPYKGVVPQDSPSRKRIFICTPTSSRDESACATKILSTLARRAYHRPVTQADTQTLMKFFQTGRTEGGFDAGIRAALEMILVNPDFLFRIERDPANVAAGTAYRISDLELATRLSFFLWSSIPDDELLGLAEKGKLKDPVVLKQQVQRMLAQPRARQVLLDNFFGQWLQVRNVWALNPDTSQKFPDFDDNLREAMEQETRLFLESQLQDDRSVLDLLQADYTFVNERLAQHYGIPDVYGSHFRRVKLTDPNRRGLLGQASILAVTSYPNRTAPTIRGKWLLENILAAPMPPPPANVNANAINEAVQSGQPATIREMLETHRKNPMCASCHARMDPLGLGLENFDALGRWRTTDNGRPIDATSSLMDGTKFQGPAQLRGVLLARKEQFATAATQKLLIYALGRNIEYYDGPAVRKIVTEIGADDYRWSSLILKIVESTPFQMRRSKS